MSIHRIALLALLLVTAHAAEQEDLTDRWSTALHAVRHVVSLDERLLPRWHLYVADSNHPKGGRWSAFAPAKPGTLTLSIGDGGKPREACRLDYDRSLFACFLADDGTRCAVVFHEDGDNELKRLRARVVDLRGGGAGAEFALPGEPLALVDVGGAPRLLVLRDQLEFVLVDAAGAIAPLARTDGPYHGWNLPAGRGELWFCDKGGEHRVVLATGVASVLAPLGPGEAPTIDPIVAPDGASALLVRWDQHGGHATCLRVDLTSGDAKPTPASFVVRDDLRVLGCDERTAYIADAPMAVYGQGPPPAPAVYAIAFATGVVHSATAGQVPKPKPQAATKPLPTKDAAKTGATSGERRAAPE